MRPPCSPLLRRYLGMTSLALLVSAELAQPAFAVEARLLLPPGAETQIKSDLSLPVKTLLAAANQPVKKGEVLAVIDVTKLEKELEGTRRTLASAQNERRRMAAQAGVTSSIPTGQSSQQLAAAQRMAEVEQAESSAMHDLMALQTQLGASQMRAPADGFVVQHLYAVGAKAKKRKPFLVFAEAGKTVLETTVAAGEAAPFAVGAEVRVASLADASKAFRGRVESATPSGDAVALRIRPLELPFLPLGSAAQVTLSATR